MNACRAPVHALQNVFRGPADPPAVRRGHAVLPEGLQGLEIRSAERVQALCRHSLDDSAVTGDTQIYFLEATRPPAPVA